MFLDYLSVPLCFQWNEGANKIIFYFASFLNIIPHFATFRYALCKKIAFLLTVLQGNSQIVHFHGYIA